MSLREWQKSGWLSDHEATVQEIQALLDVARRNIADAEVSGLSADGCFTFAYGAALQVATAALAASGYRAGREAHHYRVVQSLLFTMEVRPALVERLDFFRKKRNVAGYEYAGTISDSEAREMVDLALGLLDAFPEWLRAKYPHLAGPY